MAAIDRLQPWRELLAPLVPAVAEALLPWLERLDLAIGPLAAEDPLADGDPDGFLGLSRRGPYDRLLLTEWLLATEAPDEFVRRAAAGEHAFFELSRRSQAGSRVTAVFFDAGPMQTGNLRLVHLPLLLLMARRAQAAGARFFWGTVQQPETLRSSVEPDQAALLLAARSRADATADMVRGCLDLKELRAARREVWFVGGPTLAALAPGPRVELSEPLALALTALRARVRRPDRGSLDVELPLPPEDTRLRVLRDPFERRVTAPRRESSALATSGRAALFFSENGQRLFVGLAGGGFAAYPVHNSPYVTPPGVPLIFHAALGTELVAASWSKQQAILLERSGTQLTIRMVGRKGGPSRSGFELDGALIPREPGPIAWLIPVASPQGVRERAFLSAGGRYVRFSQAGQVTLRDDVRAAATINFQLTLACFSSETRELHFEIEHHDPARRALSPRLRGEIGEVFFGHAEVNKRHSELGLCAVERPDVGDWALFCHQEGASHLPIAAPRQGKVVGVYGGRREPSLLVLSPDRLQLLSHGAAEIVALAQASAPIIAVASSLVSSTIAYLTESQEVVILSNKYTRPLLQVKHDSEA